MKATTITGRTRPDSTTDTPGDVDKNGDLVDELTLRLGTPSVRAMARERRLAAAICAENPELGRLQLARILGALKRCPA